MNKNNENRKEKTERDQPYISKALKQKDTVKSGIEQACLVRY